jgi:hypothetical protein
MTHRVQQIRPGAPKTRIAKAPKILCISGYPASLCPGLRPQSNPINSRSARQKPHPTSKQIPIHRVHLLRFDRSRGYRLVAATIPI